MAGRKSVRTIEALRKNVEEIEEKVTRAEANLKKQRTALKAAKEELQAAEQVELDKVRNDFFEKARAKADAKGVTLDEFLELMDKVNA